MPNVQGKFTFMTGRFLPSRSSGKMLFLSQLRTDIYSEHVSTVKSLGQPPRNYKKDVEKHKIKIKMGY
jgi:hypothetical protein